MGDAAVASPVVLLATLSAAGVLLVVVVVSDTFSVSVIFSNWRKSMRASSVRLLAAHHSALVTTAVLLDTLFTITSDPDSTAPVLAWTRSASPADIKSAISLIRRRSEVVLPSRGGPENKNLRKSISNVFLVLIKWR